MSRSPQSHPPGTQARRTRARQDTRRARARPSGLEVAAPCGDMTHGRVNDPAATPRQLGPESVSNSAFPVGKRQNSSHNKQQPSFDPGFVAVLGFVPFGGL